MTIPLRALIVEDSADDGLLLLRELQRHDYVVSYVQVETAEAMRAALAEQQWDVVFADYSLPNFSAQAALQVLQESGLDLPFIIVSGTIGEATAVAALKAGAHDFIVKGNLARLIPALERELREAQAREQRRLAEAALQAKEEELRTMTQQLWQTARLATMGELAASIAHELNNPLAIITLRVEELLADTPPDSPRRRSLEIIEAECDRMSRLVANLLSFSRRGSQQISTVDACDEMTVTLELVQHQLRKRGIQVIKDCAADVPPIGADRQHLRQLLLNLYTNAMDAMPSGGQLTVRVARDAGPGVSIEVSDTGVGIAKADLPRIWEPFYTTKPEGKGTGLGLSICRRIVQEHSGAIQVVSRQGQGTIVRVVLPETNGVNQTMLRAT
jgi:signal transduction histidine kinase